MPLPNRWLTSLHVLYNGRGILIDCGEGTQIAMKETGVSAHTIDLILLTHFHGDHVMGLPGILMSMGMSGRTEPVTIVGPKNLHKVVPNLCVCAGIPFEVRMVELEEADYRFDFSEGSLLHIHAFAASHSVPTYGYSLELERLRKFDPERATSNNIPVKYWGRLQRNETVKDDRTVYTPDMVLGEKRKGIKVTYVTDTRPNERIRLSSRHSDLLVLEGMYGDDERLEAAKVKRHMIFSEAAEIASEGHSKELWLTHFSPSETHPEQYLDATRKIFEHTVCGKTGLHRTLNYTDEPYIEEPQEIPSPKAVPSIEPVHESEDDGSRVELIEEW